MPTIHLQADLTSKQLLDAVMQLPQPELENFVFKINSLRAKYESQKLSRAESELLLKINKGIPEKIQKRYNELISKRHEMTEDSEEYAELLKLTDRIEKSDAKRIEYLIKLARIRKKPLTTLMEELGIHTPEYA
jgi:hypothetical protein